MSAWPTGVWRAYCGSGPQQVLAIAGLVAGLTLLYALAFSSIYGQPNPCIAASRRMDGNIPAGSTLANEHWDDWLPTGGVDGKTEVSPESWGSRAPVFAWVLMLELLTILALPLVLSAFTGLADLISRSVPGKILP